MSGVSQTQLLRLGSDAQIIWLFEVESEDTAQRREIIMYNQLLTLLLREILRMILESAIDG